MTGLLDLFRRLRKGQCCPVCQKPDWCLVQLVGSEPMAAICQRIESPHRRGEAGWLHQLQDELPRVSNLRWSVDLRVGFDPAAIRDMSARAELAHRRLVERGPLERLAAELGVSPASLLRLRAGCNADSLWFPMENGRGAVVGIRTRRPNGEKRSIKGSTNGLFVPDHLQAKPRLFIAEGPTDTAALLSVGLEAVGRPSCAGGSRMLRWLIHEATPERVVVVADGDAAGHRGAWILARELRLHCRDVRVISPPDGIKDAREWVRRGAQTADVELSVASAAPVALEIRGGGR